MKRILLFGLIILLSSITYAQTFERGPELKIEILEDDPEKAYTNFISIDVLGADFDWDFLAPAIYAGVSGRWDVAPGFTLEGALRPSFSLYGESSFGIASEANVFYPFASNTKTTDVRVNTGFSQETTAFTTTSTTSFFETEGKLLKQYGARGGLYYKTSGFQSDEAIPVETSVTQAGVFIGLQQTRQARVKTRISNDKIRFGAGFTRIYADFMILPGSGIADDQVEKASEKDGSIGYRLGMQYYLNPYERGFYKLWGASMLNAEIGSLPFVGFYVNVGYAVVIMNRKK